MLYTAFYISKSRYDTIIERVKEKCTTNKIRYSFDLYQVDGVLSEYVFSHQIDLGDKTHYNYKLIAKDMRLDLGLDKNGLHVIHKFSARGRGLIPLTILN